MDVAHSAKADQSYPPGARLCLVPAGALNVKLLEKIEELTLYTLEQEAQLQQQQHINKTLMERLTQIESQLNQHEKPTP